MVIDDNSSNVVTFLKPPRYTNIDYQEKVLLCVNNIAKLRLLSADIEQEDNFKNHLHSPNINNIYIERQNFNMKR